LLGTDAELRVDFEGEVLPIAVAAVERVVFVHHPNVVTDEQEFDRLDRFPVFELALVCLECRLRGLLGNTAPEPGVFDGLARHGRSDELGLVPKLRGERYVVADRTSCELVVSGDGIDSGVCPASRGRFRVR